MNDLQKARLALLDAQDNIDKITAQLGDTTRAARHRLTVEEYREWRSKAQLAKQRYRMEARKAEETINQLTAIGDVLYQHLDLLERVGVFITNLLDDDIIYEEEAKLIKEYITMLEAVNEMQREDYEPTGT